MMNKVLFQFKHHLGKDAGKAEKRWMEKAAKAEKTNWKMFKQFWKDEIHHWEMTHISSTQAN